jgi:hypothetical protein
MQSAVIENGFAVVAGEIVVFNYDSLTRAYLSQTTEFIPVGVSIPANACTDKPLAAKKVMLSAEQSTDRMGISGGSSR